jgi:hypothetical protein
MVGTIGFAGSKARAGRHFARWWATVGLPHVLASVAAGALAGVVAGLLGSLVRLRIDIPTAVIVVVLVGLALADVARVPANFVARGRQVPLSWKHTLPASLSAPLYGATLGLGFASTVYFWSYWALLALLLGRGSPLAGLAVGSAYGLGRTLPALLTALTLRHDDIARVIDAIYARQPLVRTLSVLATAGIVGAVVGSPW